MRLNPRELAAAVGRRIHERTLQPLLRYVKAQNPTLWGQGKKGRFVHNTILLALYKDLYRVGYQQLFRRVDHWYPTSHQTLRLNTQRLRPLFKKWAITRIRLGTLDEWKEAVRGEKLKGEFKVICLWLDSSDFRLIGKCSTSTTDPNWSFKENSPARRYAVLCDAEGDVKKIWGGYSPKIFDGFLVEANREWFETALAGAGVAADNHFEWGAQHLTQVTFKTLISAPKGRRKKNPGGGVIPKTLTKQQRAYNDKLRSIRNRIENPFARMQGIVKALETPFWEGEDQLDCVVWLAAALINHD